jgi:riboflavin kinase/FMN adenylyltransferase
MRRFQTKNIPDDARGAAVAIGNFDGVHLGHQAIIDVTRKQARKNNAPLGILTFEPHPRSFFSKRDGKELPPFRLLNADARFHQIEKLGVDLILEIPFDQALCELSDWEFSQKILRGSFGLSHVVVGSDFCFGKGRQGNVLSLGGHGAQLGFGVTIAQLENYGDHVISSTNIRKALIDADPQKAAAMLGHLHRIEGAVEHGEKRGRTLGYPTINTGPHAGHYKGVSSIGVRPMFGQNHPNFETFIFDFAGDLYGETISVGLVEYLRGEKTFDGVDSLVTQMDSDCVTARNILEKL